MDHPGTYEFILGWALVAVLGLLALVASGVWADIEDWR